MTTPPATTTAWPGGARRASGPAGHIPLEPPPHDWHHSYAVRLYDSGDLNPLYVAPYVGYNISFTLTSLPGGGRTGHQLHLVCDSAGPGRRHRALAPGAPTLAAGQKSYVRYENVAQTAGSALVLASRADGPEAVVQRRELARQLEARLAALPFQDRPLIVLRDIHDLSYVEIAATAGCPLGTVKSRLSRARAKLRAALRRHRPGLDWSPS